MALLLTHDLSSHACSVVCHRISETSILLRLMQYGILHVKLCCPLSKLKSDNWVPFLCNVTFSGYNWATTLLHCAASRMLHVYFQIWQVWCHTWVISSISARGQQIVTEMKCIGKPISLTKVIHKLLVFLNLKSYSIIPSSACVWQTIIPNPTLNIAEPTILIGKNPGVNISVLLLEFMFT